MSRSVAIVTGASSGIGKARRFGWPATSEPSSPPAAEETGRSWRRGQSDRRRTARPRARLDGTDGRRYLVSKTLERFGRIDSLVNIAGAVPGSMSSR